MAAASTSHVERSKPNDIKFDDVVMDICCHPLKDVIAAGHIGGEVNVYSYSTTGENQVLLNLSHHKNSCRAVCFSTDGNSLYTTSKDKSLQAIDMDTGAVSWKLDGAHESAIYSLLVIGESFLATGDDDGTVKLWDLRTKVSIMNLKECEEFISDLAIDKKNKTLLAASGEGTLTAFNIRSKKMDLQSELFDSELLSLAILKDGEKVVCGTGEGALNVFNWGEWGNISDRIPGHPMSIDCLVAINEDIVCTGSLDGSVRAVNILPNKFFGVIGKHDDFPVENLSVSRDKKLLASCSHDQRIKFWNIEDVEKIAVSAREKTKRVNISKLLHADKKGGFFSDLVEDEDDDVEVEGDIDDDDDDSDDEFDSDVKIVEPGEVVSDSDEDAISIPGGGEDDDDDDDDDDIEDKCK